MAEQLPSSRTIDAAEEPHTHLEDSHAHATAAADAPTAADGPVEETAPEAETTPPTSLIDQFNAGIEAFYLALANASTGAGDDASVSDALNALQASLDRIRESGEEQFAQQVPALEEMLHDCRSKCVRHVRTQHGDVLRNVISQTRRRLQEKSAGMASDQLHQQRHVQLLVQLLGENSNIVNDVCANGWDLTIVQQVCQPFHELVSEVSVEILEKFRNDKNLTAWENRARAIHTNSLDERSGGSGSGSGTPSKLDGKGLDVQAMDFLLDQMAYMLQLVYRYQEFYHNFTQLDANNDHLRRWHELRGSYVSMEDTYLMTACFAALRERSGLEVEEGIVVLAGGEDCFFIIQKVLERAISTFSEGNALAIANRVTEILDPLGLIFRTVTDHRVYRALNQSGDQQQQGSVERPPLSNGSSSSQGGTKAASSHTSPPNSTSSATSWLLGSATLAMQFVQALEDDSARELSDENALVFFNTVALCRGACKRMSAIASGAASDGMKALALAAEELSRVSAAYDTALKRIIIDFTDRHYDYHIQEVLQHVILSARYDITGEEYERIGDDGPINNYLTKRLDTDEFITQTMKKRLTDECFAYAIEELAVRITADMLDWIEARTFSEWGGMLFSHEVRALCRWFEDISDGQNIRPALAQLHALAQILTLDRPADITRYRICPNVLTEDVARRVLLRRSDFAADIVMKAKLVA